MKFHPVSKCAEDFGTNIKKLIYKQKRLSTCVKMPRTCDHDPNVTKTFWNNFNKIPTFVGSFAE